MYPYKQKDYLGLKILATVLIVIAAISATVYLSGATPVIAISSQPVNEVGVFHPSDVVATAILPTPAPNQTGFYQIEAYVKNCKTIIGIHTSDPVVAAVLSTKQYISAEEIPVITKMLQENPAKLADMSPRKNGDLEWSEMIRQIAAFCK